MLFFRCIQQKIRSKSSPENIIDGNLSMDELAFIFAGISAIIVVSITWDRFGKPA